jgi:putative hemolysin
MNVALLVFGALAGIALSAAVSAIETGTYVLNRVRLRVRAGENYPGARRLARLADQQSDVVLMALLGNTLADYVASACVTALLLGVVRAGTAELWTTVILTPALLVFGGLLPKDWFRREADHWMYVLAWPVDVAVRAVRVTGVLWATGAVSDWLQRRLAPERAGEGRTLMPRAHMLRLLHEGAAQGGLTTFQRDLIDRVLNLSNVRVSTAMIPRARVAAVPHDISRADFLRIARMAHFSRYPVYRDDPRRIIGLVVVFDVLTDDAARPPGAQVQPVITLQEGERVSAALLRLQQARQTLAIVQDRNGLCVGMLTLKDLVEEIVGDLEAW